MPHQCTNCGHTFPDGSKEMLSGCPDCGGNKFQFRPDGVPDDESPPDTAPADSPEPADDSAVSSAVGKAAASVRDLVSSDDPRDDSRTQSQSQSQPSPDEPTRTDTTADADTTTEPDASADTETTPDADADTAHPDADVPAVDADREDTAQASARSDMVQRTDLPKPEERETDRSDAAERDTPDMDELRDQLDDATQSETGSASREPGDERPDMDELREELNDQFESIRIVAPGQYELNLMELYDREEYIIALQENGRYVIEVPDTWDDPE